jgi:hypothetical protein
MGVILTRHLMSAPGEKPSSKTKLLNGLEFARGHRPSVIRRLRLIHWLRAQTTAVARTLSRRPPAQGQRVWCQN